MSVQFSNSSVKLFSKIVKMDTLEVEIVLRKSSKKFAKDVINVVSLFLNNKKDLRPGEIISKFDRTTQIFLYDNLEYIIIGQLTNSRSLNINIQNVALSYYVYTLDDNGAQLEKCEDESGSTLVLSTQYMLPSRDIFGSWENLIYDTTLKEDLLKYATTMMLFSEKGVDYNVVSCNRVILLHGPPGTGKTSLCKALAHKLSIKLQDIYKRAVLLEINSHSLFSKWFSESGKLVTKMFSKIVEILEDPHILVCVLIDEVESLAHARNQCLSGNEPSDSMRVVNALLTQVDQLKRFPNVMIFATSNLSDSIDLAFVDRADIKQFVGLPGPEAIYQIYYSCIQELLKAEIIHPREDIYSFTSLQVIKNQENANGTYQTSKILMDLSIRSTGLSGRTLRKIPFLAHALFLNKSPVILKEFLESMDKAIEYEKKQRNHFSEYNKTVKTES